MASSNLTPMNDINQLPTEIRTAITRFLSYGWSWRVIADVVNYYFCVKYTTSKLQKLYEEE